jgi:sortase A
VQPRSSRERWSDHGRLVARGLGQTLLTVGVVVLLFAVYQVWFTGVMNSYRQSQLTNALTEQWDSGADPLAGDSGSLPTPPIGSGVALIRIPALGSDYVKVIVEGTTQDALTDGPGHYVGSARPGEVGNFAVAGHRGGYGSPFDDLDKLVAGDAIVIETRSDYFVYRVLGDRATGDPTVRDQEGLPGREVVDASRIDVVLPVPSRPGELPTRRLLTLTTCQERYFTLDRMIIHAEMVGDPRPKANGLPEELR